MKIVQPEIKIVNLNLTVTARRYVNRHQYFLNWGLQLLFHLLHRMLPIHLENEQSKKMRRFLFSLTILKRVTPDRIIWFDLLLVWLASYGLRPGFLFFSEAFLDHQFFLVWNFLKHPKNYYLWFSYFLSWIIFLTVLTQLWPKSGRKINHCGHDEQKICHPSEQIT